MQTNLHSKILNQHVMVKRKVKAGSHSQDIQSRLTCIYPTDSQDNQLNATTARSYEIVTKSIT